MPARRDRKNRRIVFGENARPGVFEFDLVRNLKYSKLSDAQRRAMIDFLELRILKLKCHWSGLIVRVSLGLFWD